MFKKFVLLNLFIASISFTYAQRLSPTVIPSAGGSDKINEITLDWTLGELAIETIAKPNGLLTEGFLQPIRIRNIKWPHPPLLATGYTIRVFPNPVASMLNVNINSSVDKKVSLKLLDNNGNTIYLTSTYSKGSTVSINLRNVASGVYHLVIQDSSGAVISTYEIVKAA
jgi:hypothetical protein